MTDQVTLQERRMLETMKTVDLGGAKYDTGKNRYDLVPAQALDEIVKVFTFGSEKYGDRNWEEGLKWGRLFGAIMRHLWSYWKGEDRDDESGLFHLAHAGCVIMMLIQYFLDGSGDDDRSKGKE